MIIRIAPIVAFSALTAACASQIMEGFVGQDVTAVAAQYGPPVASFPTPDGRQAFQWQIDQQTPMPATSTTTAAQTGGFVTATTTTTGGGVVSQRCFYTFYAEEGSNDTWTIVDFERPALGCE